MNVQVIPSADALQALIALLIPLQAARAKRQHILIA